MLSFAFSSPSPCPLSPFQGKRSSLNSIVPRAKPRKLNVALASQQRLITTHEEDAEESIAMLRQSLKPELMPKHVALLPDGHRRWAKERNLPFEAGHLLLRKPLEQLFRLCCDLQIEVVSIYTLSSGNYTLRSKEEVKFIVSLLESGLKYVTTMFMRDGIRLSVIGNTENLPKPLREAIERAEETTRNNKRLHVLAPMHYDGRSDITQACKALADKAKDGLIQPEDIDEKLFEEQLQTKGIDYPNPDLFIRTSGTQRLGNYMLWQMAYSEICFVEKYHPDMKEADYIRIFSDFQKRHRRFGG